MAITDFNIDPYYDDYDEDKKFLRVLFKPGYAVQARELTQLQTILQKQISRFGNHIFQNGSVVTGGELIYDNSVQYILVNPADGSGTDITLDNFNGKVIGDTHSFGHDGGIAKVLTVSAADTTNSAALIVTYTAGSRFSSNDTIYTIETTTNTAIANSNTTLYTGNSSIFSVSDGVFYLDGYFVKVNSQTLILDTFGRTPSYKIGLTITDSISTNSSDTSLLDPATEASNYQAPGADRYKITATLDKRSLASTDDTKFIELARINSGVLTRITRNSIYADLERTLARRTYDESGNYTVRPFTIDLRTHVPEAGNTANLSLITATLSPGKAYVKGFEYETISPTNLDIARARTTASINNYEISSTIGNYFVGANVSGYFDISTMPAVDLHCISAGDIIKTNTATYNSTKIGTARLRQLEYVTASNTQISNTYTYYTYLTDTRFTSISANCALGGGTTTINLGSSGASSNTTNAYLGAIIRITNGQGANDGIARSITAYNANTQIATVSTAFSTAPLTNSVYTIDFSAKDLESCVLNVPGTPIVFTANVDVSTTNKDGSVITGNTFFSDTNFNSLVFKIPQSYISTGMSDQSYRTKKVFAAQTPTSNIATITTGSATQTFVGSGALSDSDILDHFIVTTRTAAAGLAANSIVPMVSGTGRSITISAGTTASINVNNSQFTSIDVVSTIDNSSPTVRVKTLNLGNTTNVAVTSGTAIGNTTVYLTHGQVAISTPNKVPGTPDYLYVSDIHKLTGKAETTYGNFSVVDVNGIIRLSSFKVIDSQNTAANVSVSDLTNATKDITNRYTLDDGQRDGYYDHGTVTLKFGVAAPTGRILVIFDYFTHTSTAGTGYLTVDSYNSSTNLGANTSYRYAKIPNYVSPTTGDITPLRDAIDFRPIRANASNTSPGFTLSGSVLPKKGEGVLSDYSYYLPRRDRIVLKSERQFEVLQGIPSSYPQTPTEPDNAMSLYTLLVPPYTFFPSDCTLKFVENKRYTMRDIGKLEKRIDNIEYYTTLNLLEKQAKELVILDTAGLTRFKNGILVDSFTGHSIGDVNNFDYVCAIDSQKGELRPSFTSNSTPFSIDTSNTTSNVAMSSIVTAPYTVTPVITQDVVSTSLKINEFLFTNWVGTAKIYPSGDVWIDKNQRPDVLVNMEGNNDAWVAIGTALSDTRAPGWSTAYNDWQTLGTGVYNTSVQDTTETYSSGYLTYQDQIRSTVTVTETSQTRSGFIEKTLVPERLVQSIGDRQVDISIIPYIRAQKLYVKAEGLAPNYLVYGFFDGINIGGFVQSPSILRLYNTSGDFIDTFGNFETITSSSGGTAKVLKQVGQSWSLEDTRIYIIDNVGTFLANDTITGATSGATAKIDIPEIFSGNVTSATANTIIFTQASPYNSYYSDFANTQTTLVAANTYFNTRGTFDTAGMTAAELNTALGFNTVKIIAGTGLGQSRTITSYVGATKTATISSVFTTIPDATSIWSVGRGQTDDSGFAIGKFHLPSYSDCLTATNNGYAGFTSGYGFRTGIRKLRICDSPTNNEDDIGTFADVDFLASGILNTVENVSISVRVPTIQPKSITETRNIYNSTTARDVLSSTVIADNTPQGGGGGGGGGCGCKIICTKLHQLGYLPDNIYEADERFGQYLRENDPYAYYGYVKWASVVVDWMEKDGPQCMFWIRDKDKRNQEQRNMAISWSRRIATPWAEHMAYMMGVGETDNRAGRLIMKTGIWISRLVGKYTKTTQPTKSVALGYAMWSVFGLFWLLAGLNVK